MSPSDDLFALAWSITLREEDGHNANDEGSDTWYGIRRANNPDVTPWPPTKEQAEAIAKARYWEPYRFHLLPAPLACAAFDWIFNGGPAVSTLQRLLGVQPDGRIGENTSAAAARCDVRETLARYLMERALYYIGLHSFDNNSRSWLTRLFHLASALAPMTR